MYKETKAMPLVQPAARCATDWSTECYGAKGEPSFVGVFPTYFSRGKDGEAVRCIRILDILMWYTYLCNKQLLDIRDVTQPRAWRVKKF